MYNPQLNEKEITAPVGAKSELDAAAEAVGGEYILSLRDFLRFTRRRLWVILAVAVLLTGATLGFSLTQTPMYRASVKILVGQEQTSSVPGNLGGDVQGLQQLTRTVAEGINNHHLAEAVIQRENLQMSSEDFLKHLTVKQIPETQYIQVNYEDPSPERAQRIANSIGDVTSEQVSKVSVSANAITATVWEWAEVPDKPVSPNLVLNIGLGLMGGLILGAGLAFLLEYLYTGRPPEQTE